MFSTFQLAVLLACFYKGKDEIHNVHLMNNPTLFKNNNNLKLLFNI